MFYCVSDEAAVIGLLLGNEDGPVLSDFVNLCNESYLLNVPTTEDRAVDFRRKKVLCLRLQLFTMVWFGS